MTQTIQMVNPVPPLRNADGDLGAQRVSTLAGKRVGLLYNGKPGGQHLLEGVRGALAARYQDIDFDYRAKPHAGVGAPFLDELPGNWDVAVVAVGDCGSCSSYAIHDATELEKRGIPTVVFVSTPFTEMSRLWARQLDVPNLGIVVVDHPLAHLPASVLADEWGAPRADEVIGLLAADQ
ncbi:UGSC family (seleno)protein [Microbacterium invictum]|uniref:UGSC-like domain-containing protein n=1 Tax=Microbacterium invictum TaxID=515415 RepID=A0AA40SRW9_9MICO|nr:MULTISPECIES: hypothetical protein [Microbacterium]MBB4141283.1 hypothetical protein [Microbacterium invictum]